MIFYPKQFRAIRESLNMTQSDVANALGIKYQSIQGWEYGKTVPRMQNIYRLAKLFHCNPAEFADFEPGEYHENRITMDSLKEQFGRYPFSDEAADNSADAVEKFRAGLLLQFVYSDIMPSEKDKAMKLVADFQKKVK